MITIFHKYVLFSNPSVFQWPPSIIVDLANNFQTTNIDVDTNETMNEKNKKIT